MDSFFASLFENLGRTVIIFTVAVFFVHKIILLIKKAPNALDGAFLKCLTAAGIPNGVAFLACAWDSKYVLFIQDSSQAFVLAGLALLTVSTKDIIKSYSV